MEVKLKRNFHDSQYRYDIKIIYILTNPSSSSKKRRLVELVTTIKCLIINR